MDGTILKYNEEIYKNQSKLWLWCPSYKKKLLDTWIMERKSLQNKKGVNRHRNDTGAGIIREEILKFCSCVQVLK